jgi:hypothetical protein
MNIKFISWQIAVVLIVVFLFIRQYVFPELSSYPDLVPDSLYFYSADELRNIIGNYTEIEKSGYIRASISFDFLYPLVYGTMIFVIISLIFKVLRLSSKKLLIISLMPFIATLLDFSENFGMFYLINNLPDFNAGFAQILGWITLMKWGLVGLSVLATFIVVNYTISYRIRHKRKIISGL